MPAQEREGSHRVRGATIESAFFGVLPRGVRNLPGGWYPDPSQAMCLAEDCFQGSQPTRMRLISATYSNSAKRLLFLVGGRALTAAMFS